MGEKNPRLIDAGDVATWLSLPRRKVIAMARECSIPCYSLPCGDYVFDAEEIAAWLQARRVKEPREAAHG